MPTLIPRRAKLHDVLSLSLLIQDARDDIVRARHAFGEAQTRLRVAELAVGTTDARLACIVDIYNRLVVEYEPQKGER